MKTLLVECLTPQSKPRMDEVNDIAKAAGYNVVGQVTQHREAIDAAYCIGEGKLDEISRTIEEDSIEALIFTRQLSAGQLFRIKKKSVKEPEFWIETYSSLRCLKNAPQQGRPNSK